MTPFERLNAIRDLRTLRGTPKVVLLVIALRANAEGACWPSVETIAADAGVGTTAARSALRALEHDGWIRVVAEPGRQSTIIVVEARLTPTADVAPTTESVGVPQRQALPTPTESVGAPTPSVAEQITNRSTNRGETREDARTPEAGVLPGRPPVRRRVEPAELFSLEMAYGEAMRALVGRDYAVPRGQRWELAALAELHGGATPTERGAWLPGALARFHAATANDAIGFGSGYPRAFRKWLDAGSPANGYARAGPRAAASAEPAPYHEEWSPD